MDEGQSADVHEDNAPVSSAQLDSLTDELLRRCLTGLALEELIHVAHVNCRFRGLVYSCDEAWQQLYHQVFTGKQQLSSAEVSNSTIGCWRERFKERFVQDAKDVRLKRKVKMIKLQSSISVLRKEMLDLTAELRKERAMLKDTTREVQDIKRARLAQVGVQTWQPQSVQLHYNRVLQATPIDSQWRLTALEQEVKVCQLRIGSMENSMAVKRSQLQRDEKRLKFLKG